MVRPVTMMDPTLHDGLTVPDQPWREHANCKNQTALMYDTHPDAVEQAKEICDSCPVIVPCRMWAHETHQEYGVWGGVLMRLRNTHHCRPRAARKCLVCDNQVTGRARVCSDKCRHIRDNQRKTRQRQQKA
jgi:WhiB family transcriptional regulator, redox-sensing transcriptional regulator